MYVAISADGYVALKNSKIQEFMYRDMYMNVECMTIM